MSVTTTPIDLTAIRARLATAKGKAYWRSLEELADTPEFHELLRREFPRQANAASALSRRDFLKFTAAALALAGLSACTTQPVEKIVPYVDQPKNLIPGRPLFFATALPLAGYAAGVVVESHEGRPTKIEGNPDHPASLGATDSFAQAEILTLYDPDRSQHVLQAGQPSTWADFVKALGAALKDQTDSQGAGLRILTGTVTSPTLASQLDALLKKYPSANWHQYEAVNRDNVYAGGVLAFGQAVEPVYHFDKAQVILSLDADFLRTPAGGVRYTRDFSDARKVRADQTTMNRLYALESTPSITGSMADHRLSQRASQIESFARSLAIQLGITVEVATSNAHSVPDTWLSALVKDFQAHKGTSLVVAGDHQPPAVHALAYAINDALGNTNNTVIYTAPVATNAANQTDSLKELAADLDAGSVQILVTIGGNPAYTAPVDVDFVSKFSKATLKIHMGLYEDETAALADWHIPETHPLEGWSDTRAYDGTLSIIQPLILPLYEGKSPHELFSALLGDSKKDSHILVQTYWKGLNLAADFDLAWKTALRDGVIRDSAAQAVPVTLISPLSLPPSSAAADENALEIVFLPDAAAWDGRFSNNGWLQELPRPLTLVTWDNVAQISPTTAERIGLASGDVVELHYQQRSLRVPVWIQPGHADESVTVTLGYGRTKAGKIGNGLGYNAYALRTSDGPGFASGVEIVKTGEKYVLASTQGHNNMENRDLIRATTLSDYQQHPDYVHDDEPKAPAGSLYPPFEYPGHAWGMAIDTSACVGCNACIIACQAENNIPTVGKDEVVKGREMHWLRVDRYFSGDLDNPETVFQPVPCMHCENAPCEPVCPVGATVHSDEGLNDMVYNRCIGTKYCSNNCPYKVRHFNFFEYSNYEEAPVLKLLHNPDVTVRSRGVMEKCTYCVQRIQNVKITADREGRAVADGEIRTACQQVCPAQAIVFGDVNDPNSRVSQLKAQPHNYALLAELNTRPRTTYLGKVRNPNPEIEE